ncbi:hypothetical protein STENM327S_07680 [Streptomyces tendae]
MTGTCGAPAWRLPALDAHTPHDRVDAGHQLAEAVRLDQVVVRAGLESEDSVQLRAACGDDDERDTTDGADGLAHLEAVQVRQFEFHQDEVHALMGGQGDAAPVRGSHLVTVPAQRLLQGTGRGGVALDEQDAPACGAGYRDGCRARREFRVLVRYKRPSQEL